MRRLTLVLTVAMTIAACGGGANNQQQPAATAGAPAESRANVSVDKNAYPVFPDADAGADPSVPAEQGGKGFTGEGWETNTDFDSHRRPARGQGRRLRRRLLTDFPGTLRYVRARIEHGAGTTMIARAWSTSRCSALHPTTLDYIPALATHWQISADKMTLPLPHRSERALLRRPAGDRRRRRRELEAS